MTLNVQLEQEAEGRWIAAVLDLSRVCCGPTREEALAKVRALALRAVVDRIEHGKATADLDAFSFESAA